MFRNSIRLRKDLAERAAKIAEKAGYSSLEEFIEHLVEKELARFEGAVSDEEIMNKLKGLGYLD